MRKLNILKLIDEWGWAYHFVGVEQQRYTRHNIMIQQCQNVNLNGVDILYLHGPNMKYPNEIYSTVCNARDRNIKIIGGYGGETPNLYPYANAIATISPQTYDFAKKNYPYLPKVFLPESIDNNYFVSSKKFNENSFKVGYAGSPVSLKRTHLFDRLKYPVLMKTDWGKPYFVENRSQESMKEFYESIDVLILLSRTECMPRVVLEAMSMGLPVITTKVGCLDMLLDKKYLVDVYPEEEVIRQTNEKLTYLSKYPNKRKENGLRNKEYIEKYFSWKVTQPLWDDYFEKVYIGNKQDLIDFPNYMAQFSN